ncbi:MAG: amidohydrolase family protein [Ramlibacter sp.]
MLYYGFYDLDQNQLDLFDEVRRRVPCTVFFPYQDSSGYAFDNTCTLGGMKQLGAGARGVAVIRHDVEEAELIRLHDAGMRGVRFMMLSGGVLPWTALEPIARRIAPLGWNINLQLDGHDLAQHEAMLAALPCRLVIDHLGKFLSPVTNESAGFQALQRLMGRGNCWIKLSAPYESSKSGPPGYDDVQWIPELLAREFPERCLWASNWPHPNVNPTPRAEDMLDWFFAWVPDEATRRKILVANPAALYGF